MIINSPKLPPRDGYFEDVDPVTGERIYVETEEHKKKVDFEEENRKLKETVELLEECIAEMASVVYK